MADLVVLLAVAENVVSVLESCCRGFYPLLLLLLKLTACLFGYKRLEAILKAIQLGTYKRL